MANILIFEPEERIAEAVSKVIEAEGHEVSTATELPAALELVKEQAFDLVFCDSEAVGAVLEAGGSAERKPLVIATCLMLEKPAVLGALREGAFRFLTKPLGMRELRKALAEAMEELETAQGE